MTTTSTPPPGGAGAPEPSTVSRLALPIAVVVVVVLAAIAAIALTGGGGDGSASASPSAASTPVASAAASTPAASDAASAPAPSDAASTPVASDAASTPIASASIPAASGAPSASTAPSAALPSGAPVISGTPLPLFTQSAGDPAIGQTIPTVEGADFAGAPVSISLDGKPKVILFLAHWCAHCQAAVPLIQDWIDGGGAPDDVELISVATAIDPNLPNYPPEEWLAREGWTVPVIVDETGTVATAYGLSAFPFWTFVHADGTVLGRFAGELTVADLETIIASLGR